MKKIFIVTYGGGHANIIRSIYKKLERETQAQIIILALTMAPGILKKAGIPFVTVSEIAKTLDNYGEIVRTGSRLAETHHKEGVGIAYEDSVAYLGIGYCDLLETYGEEEARALFIKEGRKAFLPVSSMTKIIKSVDPDVVLITTSPRMEKATGIAASQLKIPVVKISDLPISDSVEYNCLLCVMNDWAKEYAVVRSAIDPKSVIVTGQPVFEENLTIVQEEQERYFIDVKKDYKNCIIYLGQTGNVDTYATVNQLHSFAKKNKDILVIVRPHPNDEICINNDIIDNFCITKAGELKYMLGICDVAITHYSTAGLEAALMGKPLITVLINSPQMLRYSEYGIAEEINDITELDTAIEDLLNKDSSLNERLKKGLQSFKNKENAAENIVAVIKDQIK